MRAPLLLPLSLIVRHSCISHCLITLHYCHEYIISPPLVIARPPHATRITLMPLPLRAMPCCCHATSVRDVRGAQLCAACRAFIDAGGENVDAALMIR